MGGPVSAATPLWYLFFLLSRASAMLPYAPTHILQSSKSRDKPIYILEPPSSSAPHGRLLLLSNTLLTESKLPLTTLSKSLPFLHDGSDVAFTPVANYDGSISVYTGPCSQQQSQTSQLWKFVPDGNRIGTGAWQRQLYNRDAVDSTVASTGANWLAAGISFSSDVTDVDNFYLFGGMCPDHATSTAKSWVLDASYSSQMLVFQPNSSGDKYQLTISDSHGQPTPEAGFTITPLQPTYSRSAHGKEAQQQNFVLIGGHTATTTTAFINMNMIAIFSLPQASWTFVPVTDARRKTELLAPRDAMSVDSRSGHTAILTADGKNIIVLGGWVGDISRPAEPQLVVLDVGAGYGGSGSWKWSQWDQVPFGPGSGIYGHGAILLTGDVMMVSGGFSISGSSRMSRRSSQTPNSKNYFLNTTSGHWLSSYHLGNAQLAHDRQPTDSGPLSSTNDKAGLGAGLGFGLLALICLVFFGICFRRRLKQQRAEDRDDYSEEIGEKDSDDYIHPGPPETRFDAIGRTIDGRGGSSHASNVWNAARQSPAPGVARGPGVDAERSGIDFAVPSPNRGLRRSMHGRPGPYHSASRYDDSRYHWGSGEMHAIPERDEENSSAGSSRQVSTSKQNIEKSVDNEKENDNPFKDPEPLAPAVIARKPIRRVPVPPRGPIEPPAPENMSPAEERQREMEGWVRDWQAADAASRNNSMGSANNVGNFSTSKSGRSSPSKSERTISNLSDKSARSILSTRSGTAFVTNDAGTGAEPSRNTSSRSIIRNYLPNILPTIITNPFFTPASSPSHTMTSMVDGQPRQTDNSSRPNTAIDVGNGSNGDGSSSGCAESFATAKSTLTMTQTEHKALLAPDSDLHLDTEPTFSRSYMGFNSAIRTSAPLPTIMGGLVGSVRRGVGRALTATGVARAVSMAGETGKPRITVIGNNGYYEPSAVGAGGGSPSKAERHRSGSISPTKRKRKSLPADQGRMLVLDHEANEEVEEDGNEGMTRSVSDGAAFWTAKRGAKDWEADAPVLTKRMRTATDPSGFKAIPYSAFDPTAAPSTAQIRSASTGRGPAWRSTSSSAVDLATMSGSKQVNNDPIRPAPLSISGPRRMNSKRVRGGNTILTTTSPTSPVEANAGDDSPITDAASDWDVEAAVEQRVVQVMFTVPRERLRVVNADVDVASMVSTLREDVDAMTVSSIDDGDGHANALSLGEDVTPLEAGREMNITDLWPKRTISKRIVEEVEEEK